MVTREDDERFETLYRDHRGAVYRALLRDLRNPEDAEDATQTTFLQAYGALGRGSRPERPRAWLLTIADNLRRRFWLRERRLVAVPLDEHALEARADERVEGLREALEALPRSQRSALLLREVGGLSYAEIAHRLGTSVGAVQMLLFRARKRLQVEVGSAGRRAGLFAPNWLTNLLSGGERLAVPVRAAGALVVAAAAIVAVPGAESASPQRPDERHRPPAAAAHDAPPTVSVRPVRQSAVAAVPAPRRGSDATRIEAPEPARRAPVPVAVPRPPEPEAAPAARPAPLLPASPLPAPPLPTPALPAPDLGAPALPVPAVPLPEPPPVSVPAPPPLPLPPPPELPPAPLAAPVHVPTQP